MNPTQPTSAPSAAPTIAPRTRILNRLDIGQIIGVIVGSSIIFIVIILIICLTRYYKREKKSLYISNGLVIIVGIGKYDDPETVENPDIIDGYLPDLDPIENDIKNMIKLFHDKLNYDIYPSEYLDDIENKHPLKMHWTEKELHEFLIEKAKYLEENIETYDGLIVVISSHGLPRRICTSDYKTFSKIEINRIFSRNHPKSREIPRIFLFDCCAANIQEEEEEKPEEEEKKEEEKEEEKHENSSLLDNETDKAIKHGDISKQISMENCDNSWKVEEGQRNPDWRLAMLEAANPGFQAKANQHIGSYVIYSFYSKTMDILDRNKNTFLHETFDEIQMELHGLGKQHPQYIWNEDTKYIRFKRNKEGNNLYEKIEIEQDESKSDNVEIEMENVKYTAIKPVINEDY